MANQKTTFDLAINSNIIVRTVRNINGHLIANVQHLNVGDTIYLIYAGRDNNAVVRGIIDQPNNPNDSAPAIDTIDGDAAEALNNAGYPFAPNNTIEIIRLVDTVLFNTNVHFEIQGNGSIHRLTDPGIIAELHTEVLQVDHQEENNQIEEIADLEQSQKVSFQNKPERPFQGSNQPFFDRYIMIDWSSSSVPVRGRDSVWLASLKRNGEIFYQNFTTRNLCVEFLINQLNNSIEKNERVLVGFDFPFGYPLGFKEALGFESWTDLVTFFRQTIQDGVANQHNRDNFCRDLNQRLGNGPGPFWGVHNNAADNNLTTTRVGLFTFPYEINNQHGENWTLAEFRQTELACRQQRTIPQSVWKLNQGVSVGGQAIMGIGRLGQLIESSESLTIWPQMTGWNLPEDKLVVVAEIFPSLIVNAAGNQEHLQLDQHDGNEMCPDLVQVLLCCQHACHLDSLGHLIHFFGVPLNCPDPELIGSEEGWILWSNSLNG